MNSPHPYTVESLIVRRAVLRFLMAFAGGGGANFGATPFTDATARVLDEVELIIVGFYKPPGGSAQPHHRRRPKVRRRYRAVSVDEPGKRFVALLREELRQRNIATVFGIDDGIGRVAFEADYRERRDSVVAAALAALGKWRATEAVSTHAETTPSTETA